MAGKFQLRSRAWDLISLFGFAVLCVAGYGLIFVVGSGSPALTLLIGLGIVTFLLFAGPGIVYSLRKRTPALKKRLPGGTFAWIRSHAYLPILALIAAFVHATAAPYRAYLSSGKLTLLVGALLVISGFYRHRLLGYETEAAKINDRIRERLVDQPREFRLLVTDRTESRRPRSDIEADAAQLPSAQAALWREIAEMLERVEPNFPAAGGQSRQVRNYKLWRFLHVPLTVLLFALLAYHVWDVLGGKRLLAQPEDRFAASSQCAGCHSTVAEEWGRSAMAHGQTGAIMEAQLPVTIAENKRLAAEGAKNSAQETQEEIFEKSAKTCINCHAQVGARFTDQVDALLPLNEAGSAGDGGKAVPGGGEAVHQDGVGCIVCHTQAAIPPELAGAGELAIDNGDALQYGTQFGPLFDDPDPLPVRVHDVAQGEGGVWNDPTGTSQMCGACHNVKIDLDGDGVSQFEVDEGLSGETATRDSDGDFQLDQNELDVGEDDQADDLVLQTTFDEWQDYLVGFAERFKDERRTFVERPLGCTECHMPAKEDGPVVDHAPGLSNPPDRQRRSHAFVGVDYDLELPGAVRDRVLAERQALLGSAVELEVVNRGAVGRSALGADVIVRNNFLGHAFPTGFAFARQFWLEVSAETDSGRPVCLRPPDGLRQTPCASGVIGEVDEELRQCDPASVRAVNRRFAGNADVQLEATFPADQCDPWLTNFQKILTDGDPDGDGVFTEVPYQAFLPDIVKIRTRVATQQAMTELQPVRLRVDPKTKQPGDDSTGTYNYIFDSSDVRADEKIIVRAKLRFRHLPPYFVRALEERLSTLKNIPKSARIDADELLENMRITDVVEASSDKAAQVACDGPQNAEGASILECVEAIEENGRAAPIRRSRSAVLAAGVFAAAVVPVAGRAVRRRTRRLP